MPPDRKHLVNGQQRGRPPASNTESQKRRQSHSKLKKIWEKDQRMPSIISRRAWAIAHDIDPIKVHNFFGRKRAALRKSGIAVSDEIYELAVGDDVEEDCPLVSVKDEPNDTENTTFLRSSPSPPPSDATTLINLPRSSSYSVCSSPCPQDFKNSGAYSHGFNACQALDHVETLNSLSAYDDVSQFPTRPRPLQNDSIGLPSSRPLCKQRPAACSASDFLCALCDTRTEIDDAEIGAIIALIDPAELYALDQLLGPTLLDHWGSTACDWYPRIQSDTLMELSAIPFLDRSPDFLPLDIAPAKDCCCWEGYSWDGFWLGPPADEPALVHPMFECEDAYLLHDIEGLVTDMDMCSPCVTLVPTP